MEKERKFNTIITVIFVLVIVRHGINIVTQLMSLLTPETIEFEGHVVQFGNHAVSAYNMILSVAIIATLALVLCKKMVGAYAFFALQVINCIVISIWGIQDLITNIVVSAIMCAIFMGLLYLRKDGTSGWDLLRNIKSEEG